LALAPPLQNLQQFAGYFLPSISLQRHFWASNHDQSAPVASWLGEWYSAVINRRHQQYFELQKEAEQNNLDQKTVICEIIEGMEYDTFKTFADWEDKTKEILALQAKWKTIGPTPQKMNTKIFERFRAACDNFFKQKAAFYKYIKENMAKNLEKKKALCEKAESLKDSTDWKETAQILTQLQKEWKTIGPVGQKHSESVWKRFIGACDYFFSQKNKANSSQRSEEVENLTKKENIIRDYDDILYRMTEAFDMGFDNMPPEGDKVSDQLIADFKKWKASLNP
jgi:hypothetical protein